MNDPKCDSCGVRWREHLGVEGTCAALKLAIRGLKAIEREANRRDAKWALDAVKDILSDIENSGE